MPDHSSSRRHGAEPKKHIRNASVAAASDVREEPMLSRPGTISSISGKQPIYTDGSSPLIVYRNLGPLREPAQRDELVWFHNGRMGRLHGRPIVRRRDVLGALPAPRPVVHGVHPRMDVGGLAYLNILPAQADERQGRSRLARRAQRRASQAGPRLSPTERC